MEYGLSFVLKGGPDYEGNKQHNVQEILIPQLAATSHTCAPAVALVSTPLHVIQVPVSVAWPNMASHLLPLSPLPAPLPIQME